MCGIFGEWVSGVDLIDQETFRKLNALSKKRGPDDEGYFKKEKKVQFGFNRLAIQDLSEHGQQPMQSPSGRYTMVFNGEIYNHQEIRSGLKDEHQWRGTGDSETMVHALDELGLKATVDKLNGMFAIAVYDHKENGLSLVRDFAGIKPLHYALKNHRLVFASQYDQISKHPEYIHASINERVLKLYLKRHYIPAPFGILKHTWQVLPGEIVQIDAEMRVTKERYWEMPEEVQADIRDVDQAEELLNEALSESVKAELISDVPLGAFLSGGIDSPLICKFANQYNKERLKAFSIGSDSPTHDESDDARSYAEQLELDFNLQKMDSEQASVLFSESMQSLKEPYADFSILPTWLVSRLAKEKVTVALSGDGGDELFFGYERFWSVLKNLPFDFVPQSMRYLMYGADKVLFSKKHINDNFLASTWGEAHARLHSRTPDELLNQIFPDLRSVELPDDDNVYQYHGDNELELLGKMRKAEFYGMMQKTLQKVDRASMDHSLEVRVPFLSKHFIEASLRIDPYLSYGKDQRKTILKTMLKNLIPGAPIDQRKRGFTIPLSNWIRGGLKEPFEDMLLHSHSLSDSFACSRSGIESMFREHVSKTRDYKWPIFTLYSLFHWQACRGK